MLIVMDKAVTDLEIEAVVKKIERLGYKANPIPGAQRIAIGITGNQNPLDPEEFESMPGVKEAIRVTKPYKLVSREMKKEDSVVSVRGRDVGGARLAVIAGPCAVETEDQAIEIGEIVARAGANFYRGGAYKPRTSPYSFQGLGEKGLKILAKVREATGLPIVTEAMDTESVSLVEEYADVIQIGARNMQNFSLLKRVGKSRLPVFLKRGISATMDELLMSAEYVAAEGNYRVMLCERGVRTFADHARNTLDLSVVPAVKHLSHLPILVDPSHGTGRRDRVAPLARAAIAAGADGIMVEVHNHPDKALSDGPQALYPEQFAVLVGEIRALAPLVARTF
ncbi:MAG TPA: 3-deoxy-7-phosphoheptulonate synthase [Candidatus Polarisedimenticolia bacterium]|jgi:3-deoxy-7-phosphoheptulonate synthase|nr:3-deoxy-7-phosphoheptulonate synthase [Candidatus Polarisedimenticolia bacterium]